MILPFPDTDVESTIAHRFEKVVALVPDRPAVILTSGVVTYAELNRKASRLAHTIVKDFCTDSEPVALICEHGLSVLVGILAVLKAGKFYIALSPTRTFAEQAKLLELVQPRLVITDDTRQDEASAMAAADQTLLNLDGMADDKHQEDDHKTIPLTIDQEMPAALFYTSGSTGEIKGVLRGQKMLLHHYQTEIIADQICTDDRLSFIHDCAFAGSTAEIFRALLAGASVCPLNIRDVGISDFLAWLQANQISSFHSPVPLFGQVIHTLPENTLFPHLRQISLGGEKVYAEDIRKFWHKMATPCTIRHTFSTSETGLLALENLLPNSPLPDAILPAGFPVSGKDIRLLDQTGKQVPPGEIGEIVVTSRYLAVGYWANPSLTSQRFLTDPADPALRTYATGDLGRIRPDGRLECTGRKDSMVKIRGYQVNVNDVETAIREMDGIRDAAVVVYTPPGERTTALAAYLCSTEDSPPTDGTLRRLLAKQLQEYMIPTYFTWIEQMPTTVSGKINRKALPSPDMSRPTLDSAYAPPRTPIESEIVNIWQDALQLKNIGIHDNFLELGGHSIHALGIISRVLNQFQINVPLTELFASATVADMALAITVYQAQQLTPEALTTLLAELDT